MVDGMGLRVFGSKAYGAEFWDLQRGDSGYVLFSGHALRWLSAV